MQGWTIEVGGGGSDSFVDDSTKRVNSPSYASASLAVGIDENNDGVTDNTTSMNHIGKLAVYKMVGKPGMYCRVNFG